MSRLTDGLDKVKGIGPKKRTRLEGMGLHTLRDALFFYPFRYEDWSQLLPVAALYHEETAVFFGRVTHVDVSKSARRGVKVVKAVLEGEQGEIVATWYNRYQIENYLNPTTKILVYGRLNHRYGLELDVQEHFFIKSDASLRRHLTVHPVYSLTEGVGKVDMVRVTDAALAFLNELEEPLSPKQCVRYGMMGYRDAIRALHRPKSMVEANRAFTDLVVYEFLAITLWGQFNQQRATPGIAHTASADLAERFVEGLPYKLTGAQERAITAIMADMARPNQMHRLLQGDVGSGKTNVAFYAMLAAISNGHQAALMAPTGVLADQHYEGAKRAFEPLGIRVGRLTGQSKAKESRSSCGLTKR